MRMCVASEVDDGANTDERAMTYAHDVDDATVADADSVET